jgi:hypothetical protein
MFVLHDSSYQKEQGIQQSTWTPGTILNHPLQKVCTIFSVWYMCLFGQVEQPTDNIPVKLVADTSNDLQVRTAK